MDYPNLRSKYSGRGMTMFAREGPFVVPWCVNLAVEIKTPL